jgi:protein-S-isoprenylcysteine O-methyltransferase Ste14
MSHRTGLGAEHPLNDKLQAVFLVVFLGVWVLDSFVLSFSTLLAGIVPLLIRLTLGFLTFAVGVYFIVKSELAVFGKTTVGRIGNLKFINSGVYGWGRHPMYLGSLLVLLGLFFITLSILSLLVWVGFFVFFDKMATYEERDLYRILGEQYLNYQRQVPKWFLHIKRKKIVSEIDFNNKTTV